MKFMKYETWPLLALSVEVCLFQSKQRNSLTNLLNLNRRLPSEIFYPPDPPKKSHISCNILFSEKVVRHFRITSLVSQNTLVSQGLHHELLGPWGTRTYPLMTLSFVFWLTVNVVSD